VNEKNIQQWGFQGELFFADCGEDKHYGRSGRSEKED
jgi:hypothetical protein